MKNERINKTTGEIENFGGKLNELIIHETRRPNGTLRIQLDFSNCPTMAEQHTAHLTDLNYLIETYKPDELAAYIAARAQGKPEIIGHDFSKEPSLQDAHNIVYKSRQLFENLDEDLKRNFRNHVEFLKFIDNPANADKMIKLGMLTKKQVSDLQTPTPTKETVTAPTATKAKTKDEPKEL